MKTLIIVLTFACLTYSQEKITFTEMELLEALNLAIQHLEYQGDFTLGYTTRAEALRQMAIREEQREKDIEYIRRIRDEYIEYLRFKAHRK